jgi:hypothetical protein
MMGDFRMDFFPLTPVFGMNHPVHTFGGSISLTTLSLPKGGIFNLPSPQRGEQGIDDNILDLPLI